MWTLYKEDIFENDNLVTEEPSKSSELSNLLTDYLISVDAQMLFNFLRN